MLPKPDYKGDLDVTNDNLHYYTLLNSLDDDTIIQVLQNDTTTYQLEHYSDEVVKYWKMVRGATREGVNEGNSERRLEGKQSCWSR